MSNFCHFSGRLASEMCGGSANMILPTEQMIDVTEKVITVAAITVAVVTEAMV
jgi:hypothetical protein